MEKPKPLQIFDYQAISSYMKSKGIEMDVYGKEFGRWMTDQAGEFSGQNCVVSMPVKEFYFEIFKDAPEWVHDIVRELDKEFGEYANKEGWIDVKYWW